MVDPFLGAALVNFEKLYQPKALETHFQKFFALNEESTLIKYQYTDIDYGWKINFGRSIFSKSTQQDDVLQHFLQVKTEFNMK